MPKLLFLKGLPASGKSTYAKKLVAERVGGWKRVCKDDLRAMIDCSKHSKGNEKLVVQAQYDLTKLYLSAGHNVVCDNTNFYPKHEEEYRALAKELGCQFEVKFFDLDLDECIRRDKMREHTVGEDVIRNMYNNYIAKKVNSKENTRNRYVHQDKTLPHVIIVDLDGCTALIDSDNPRSPFDNSRVDEDIPHQPVIDLVKMYRSHTKNSIVFMSGRKDECFEKTWNWLKTYCDFQDGYDMLFMRKTEDNRKDNIVKRELYDAYVKDKFCVDFILDDRDQVCREWRIELKLPCFQVWYGDF